jgi:hypothetical protein
MTDQQTGVVVALESFAADVEGTLHVVHATERLPADHPAVKAHPERFRQKTETD